MFKIDAPHPGYQTTTTLPSPNWGDSVQLTATLNSIRTMNGTLYTYKKPKKGRKRLQWDFTLARNKALELKAFLKVYYRCAMRVTDHNNSIWIGYLQNNPFEFIGEARAYGFPGGETMTITLEFEEKE